MATFTDRDYLLRMDQGDLEVFSFIYKSDTTPVNLTGYTAKMVIFWGAYKNGETGALTIPAGSTTITGVITTPANGQIDFTISAAVSSTIPASGYWWSNQNVEYAVQIVNGSTVTTLISGPLFVFPNRFS